MTNPYLIEGPALISFSGGRTSAFMLKQILDAYDGQLADNIHVVFANTGKEREETLRFVHECGSRWGVKIHWLEWKNRLKRTPALLRFEEVGLNSASRNGEPFKALIKSKKAVPNAVQRWCTTHLKFQVCKDFMEVMGHETWNNVIGLRSDEMMRVFKKSAENIEQSNCWKNIMPLADARIRRSDVMEFWARQPFDLGIASYEGNCTKCFMKGRKLLLWEMRRDPIDGQDWAEMEVIGCGQFDKDFSMLDLMRDVQRTPYLPLGNDFEEFDAECGTHCEGDAA